VKRYWFILVLVLLLLVAVLIVFLVRSKREARVSVVNKLPACVLYFQNSNKLLDLVNKVGLYELGVMDFSLKDSMEETMKETCQQGGCWDAFTVKDFEWVQVILTKEAQPYHQLQKDGRVLASDNYIVDNFGGKKRLNIWIQVDLDLIKRSLKRNEYSSEINRRLASTLYGLAGNRSGKAEGQKYWQEVNEFVDRFQNNFAFFNILCL